MKRLMMIAALSATCGAWADTETVGGYTWTYQVNGDMAEIGNDGSTAISPSPTGAVTIPATLGGKPVTSIGERAFGYCRGLTSVTVPDGVTDIGYEAFYWCENLYTLVLPNSVTNIGDMAFVGCSALETVTVPQCALDQGLGNVFCSRDSWGYKSRLENPLDITLADGVASIPYSAFSDSHAPKVKRLSMPATVTQINMDNIRGNGPGLRNLSGSDSPVEVVIAPDNDNYKFIDGMLISYGGFGGVTVVDGSLVSGNITIPDGVMRIGWQAFYGSELTSVTIPDSVTSIGDRAFDGCGLTSVTIGRGVANIGRSAFGGYEWASHCNLTSVSVVAGNPNYSSVNGLLLSKDGRTLVQGVNGDVIIPDGVTSIGERAFGYCRGLTSIVIPDSVTSIGDRAFEDCYGLTGTLILPNGVTNIGDCAFSGCSGLTSVTIPDGVKSIGEYAFHYCDGLTSVVIPDSVTVVGYEAFQECDNLAAVTIGSGVTNIGDNAFRECPRLGRVTFRGNEPSVDGNYAFYGVASYCTVYVPRTATFNVDAGGGWMGMKVEYYDLEEEPTPEPTPTPTPTPAPTPEPVTGAPVLWTDTPADAAIAAAAATYDGYLYSKTTGALAGTIQVKVGKPGTDGMAAVKATVTGLDGKKKSLKAADKGKASIASDGPTTVALAGGDVCTVTLGAHGLSGHYGAYEIDGGLSVFASKDAADKTTAAAVLGKWQGVVNVAWKGAQGWNGLSVSIANKGKAKVSGTLADGTKASASSQLLVGEDWCCVPTVESKKAKMAFALWLRRDGSEAKVTGLAGAVVGKPGTLKAGAAFRMAATLGDAKYAAYLPDGVAVAGGTKWTLPKAGKVQLAKDGTVDAAKLLENPSALKLTYKAKDGTFKGSFKAYADANGKPKATTVNVAGVLIDGVGYGAATVKKQGGVAVTVE